MIVSGTRVRGDRVVGRRVIGRSVNASAGGGVDPDPAVESVLFSVRAMSFDSRVLRAPMEGQYGTTRAGLYWTLPANGDGVTDYYLFETHDDGTGRYVGIDPGDFVTALAGWTGIEVQHAAGRRTAAQRATAIRSALQAAAISNWTVGGSGADVEIEGTINSATCAAVGMIGTTRGQWGTRRRTAQFTGSDLSGRVGQFFVSPSVDVVVTAIGMYFADHSAQCRLALFTGGTSSSLSGTTLRCEAVTTGSSTGWNWIALTPSQCFLLPGSTNCRLVTKSNSTAEPGYIAIGDLTGTDFLGARNLEVYDTMSTSPSVAYPASLSGETADTSNGVYVMLAIQYTEVGTGAVRTSRVGIQISTPTDLGSTSSLTAPDAAGADLFMGASATGLAGWEYAAWAIAIGTTHSSQLRGFICEGGSVGNAVGATVVWQAQTTGSATQQWLEIAISAGTAHDPDAVMHWGCRNNAATVNFRFAFNADRLIASPDSNQADFVDASEYEIFNSSGAHGTNPAVAVPSPIATNGATTQANTNYPGAYVVLRYPADEVLAA